MRIGKTFTFESAHYINGHPRCGQVHGHTWTLTVELYDQRLQPNGMVMDFSLLGGVVKTILAELDHKLINEVVGSHPFFTDKPVTAETLVIYLTNKIFLGLERHCEYTPINLTCRLQEGPGGWAEYRLGEEVRYV